MKVYKIETAHPATGRHKDFASLDCKRTDSKYFDALKYGHPAIDWRTRELRVYNPAAPRPDIFHLGLLDILSPRAFEILGDKLRQSGELLPVTVMGEDGTHYLYNCTNVIDVLDPKETIYEFYKAAMSDYSKVAIPAFHTEKLRNCSLFKFPRFGVVSTYYAEHGDGGNGDLKTLIDQYRLTGWRFELLWNDAAGPVQPRIGWKDNDPFEYRSVDGKRLVYEGSKWVVKPPSKSLVPEPEPEKKEKARKKQPRVSHGKIAPTKGKPATKPQKGIRVLQVQAVIPAKRGKPKQAPCLVCKLADQTFLARDRFRGHPFPEDWRTVELNFGEEKPWKADFYFYGPGALVCSKRVIDSCALAPLEDEGEFFTRANQGHARKVLFV